MHLHAHTSGSIVQTDVLLESKGSKVCCICFFMSSTLLVGSKFNVEWSNFSEFWHGWIIMRFYVFQHNLLSVTFISNSKFCLHFDCICCMKSQVIVWYDLAENDELMSGWNQNQWVLLTWAHAEPAMSHCVPRGRGVHWPPDREFFKKGCLGEAVEKAGGNSRKKVLYAWIPKRLEVKTFAL